MPTAVYSNTPTVHVFCLGGHNECGLLSLRAKKDEETEHDREAGEGERHRGRTRPATANFPSSTYSSPKGQLLTFCIKCCEVKIVKIVIFLRALHRIILYPQQEYLDHDELGHTLRRISGDGWAQARLWELGWAYGKRVSSGRSLRPDRLDAAGPSGLA